MIESAVEGVIATRSNLLAEDPRASLATLYNPEWTPIELLKAHHALDRAVDAAYVLDGGKTKWLNDADRVAFLFQRYVKLTDLFSA